MVVVATLFGSWLALGQAMPAGIDVKAIDRAKSTIVQEIDPRLPRVPLAQWLAKLVPGVDTKWEVNDCGEQTGDPEVDRGRDFPMCVQGDLALAKDRHLYVLVVVGTFKKGLASGSPHFFGATTVEQGRPTKWVTKLGDLPAALQPGKQQATETLPNKRLHPTAAAELWAAAGEPQR